MKESQYFKVKVKISFEDAKGKMKKRSEEYLVNAVSVTEAEAIIYKEFEKFPDDWSVSSVSETKIYKVL